MALTRGGDVHELNGDLLAVVLLVRGQVDLAEAALANFLNNAIVVQNCAVIKLFPYREDGRT